MIEPSSPLLCAICRGGSSSARSSRSSRESARPRRRTRRDGWPWPPAAMRCRHQGRRSLRREEIADTFSRSPLARIYGEGGNLMNTEDLTEIERAGRRCGVCHSGRGWRRFEIIRAAEGEPVVLCGSCRVRFGDNPPVGSKPAAASDPAPAALSRSRRRTRARVSAGPSGLIASERRCARCLARSQQRWLPERQDSTTTRHSPDYRT